MHQKLDLDGVAALLKSDAETVRELFETGRLHGVCKDGCWTTTLELLESDLELFTEAARIDRYRAGIVPQTDDQDHPLTWITPEWVERALAALRDSEQRGG